MLAWVRLKVAGTGKARRRLAMRESVAAPEEPALQLLPPIVATAASATAWPTPFAFSPGPWAGTLASALSSALGLLLSFAAAL